MAQLRPFRAWRFTPGVGPITTQVAPLLERLSAEALAPYYAEPENAIHLLYPQPGKDPRAVLAGWRQRGVMIQDALPAIYPYYQTFTLYGAQQQVHRKGFLCLVRLNEVEGRGDIRLHEAILSHTLATRVELLARTQLQVAPTHGFYQDASFRLEALMDAYMAAPRYDMVDAGGVRHQLSLVQHRQELQLFLDEFATRTITLADGHHRLESAQAYRDRVLADHPATPWDSPVHYHLMYLSNAAAEAPRILPIHRLVQLAAGYDTTALLHRLDEYFYREPFYERTPLYQQLVGQAHAFGLVLGPHQWLLRLKPAYAGGQLLPLPLPDAVRQLDYTLMHYYLLDRGLGLPYQEQANSPHISYVKDYTDVLEAARQPEQLGIIMNGVTLEELQRVSETGARMPQKSTYFYPKVPAGLVFASLDAADYGSPFDKSF